MNLISWFNNITSSSDTFFWGIISFVMPVIVAIITIILGFIIGSIIGKLVSQIVKLVKVDDALKAATFDKYLERAGLKLNSGVFLGALVKWFFVVVSLLVAFDVLGLKEVTAFLKDVVLGYLPQVIVAVLIVFVAAIVAEAMQKLVVGTAKAAKMKSANLAGTITKWSIWIFAILAAIMQLGIAVTFINTLFTGIIIAVSLALGLSFGLGGQDAAARYIEKLRGDISDR